MNANTYPQAPITRTSIVSSNHMIIH